MSNKPKVPEFDVNILEDAFKSPNIDLTFPLPTDRETYVPLKSNEKISQSFGLLEHFIKHFFKVNIFDIYKNAEYRYSINKSSDNFHLFASKFMDERLEKSDEKLDEITNDLVNSELRMNLIKPKEFVNRSREVKQFMVRFYKQENSKNLPMFGSHSFIRLCYCTVVKIVAKMFPSGIWTNKAQFSNLYKRYIDDPMSIILLPNHQSHVDYVILHLIMIRFQMSIPVVIAGDNLNVAIFGSIMRRLGAIFIKRSFNNEAYTERNLNNYVEFILLNKIHFEVFIEGARSRDGKLLLPKYGVLKTLASIYHKQRNMEQNNDFDLLVQPVSITYERVYEADGYLRELIGKDKRQESFVNILTNGVSQLMARRGNVEEKILDDGFVDNRSRSLSGKIFVKLADSFTYSSFVEDPTNLLHSEQDSSLHSEKDVNLKKLGFRVLHSINEVSYLPESAIVGMSIQTFYYHYGRNEFPIKDLIPMMDFLIGVFKQEKLSRINEGLIQRLTSLTEDQKIVLVRSQIIKFFRYIQVNSSTNTVRIVNSFELLYYKNLAIHLIIHKCLASLILLKTSKIIHIKKLFHIFTGFLKNEFLFDYDFNNCHDITNILRNYTKLGLIDENCEIKDVEYHKVLATIIQPFLESFIICVDSLSFYGAQMCLNPSKESTKLHLSNYSTHSDSYPDLKLLLAIIQKDNEKNFKAHSASYPIETYNKQYLVSFFFYLDNLRLIRIFKNKSRNKTHVMIKNIKDLQFISIFMKKFRSQATIDDRCIHYMTDIVDKRFERKSNTDLKADGNRCKI